MAKLRDHVFKRAYHKPEDDVAEEFYLPAVRACVKYDRAVGFFSSTIFLLAWPSLKEFVAAGGRMRLICSPILSDGDHEALRDGYSERAEIEAGRAIAESFNALMATEGLAKPAVVLASLIAAGVIDCKIAWVGKEAGGRPKRLFHDKVGILEDRFGDRVAFKGSMNETWPGLARDGNLESVDVFASWRDEGEELRVIDEAEYFERVWDDRWPEITVRALPDTARSAIVSASDAGRWPDFVDEICLELEHAARWSAEAGRSGGRTPRPHQVAALDGWEARGRRGILKHATGSGKTFTALCAINDGLARREIPMILVPSDLLMKQWNEELRTTFDGTGLQLMLCGGGHGRWRDGARLRTWSRPGDGASRAILATIQTASSDQFRGLIVGGDHLFMVADEVHRLGATSASQLLTLETGARLGLSATPERAGDPDGTAMLMGYFGGIVPPPFELQDAIKAKALTPYAYNVHTVALEDDERAEWIKATDDFRRLYARSMAGGGDATDGLSARLKLLLIRRARIVKGARAKVALAGQVLAGAYRRGQRWIVYCDDQNQLADVKRSISEAGVDDVYEYHSAMPGDRSRTLEVFGERGGVVVSIRCLDEGVDIPAVTHALILASSKNPREFIQRRGRVLRRFPGKALAHLHDVVVVPEANDEDAMGGSILKGELARAIEFGSHAVNPGAVADLRRIAAATGFDWASVTGNGFESDDSETDELETADA
ncbi:DEAD/DEAH box helicase family protein [Sphingosinicella sp. CPCC 101087]|uniref:DEAD/DEAH box helicase family protein n=1 Tax=Sphingosinicella sp. CPCC 101087 TaxID=2497754 RepID=UPI00101E1F51|nr:DEAD/DEAH box helicase family protein [Sphingosinicella sp. CPCC 101087]